MSKRKPLTEEQWLSESTAYPLLRYLQQHHLIARRVGGKRQLRLLAVGCCRAAWPLFTNENCRRAIEVAERAADGKATRLEVRAAVEVVNTLIIAAHDGMRTLMSRGVPVRSSDPEVVALQRSQSMAAAAAYSCIQQGGVRGLQIVTQSIAILRRTPECLSNPQLHAQQMAEVDRRHSELIREVYGNPFRTVALDPRWLSSTVRDLARTIYDERAWERMPILSDALMDAGCDNEEILNHCRGDGPHARGCCLVDAILGKVEPIAA